MQEKYGKLFDSLDEHVDEISKKNNYEEWKNVRAFYEIFKGKFISNIQSVREATKRQKLNEQLALAKSASSKNGKHEAIPEPQLNGDVKMEQEEQKLHDEQFLFVCVNC